MVIVLEALGIRTESHHHEVGGPGQGEIDLRFLPLLEMADALLLYKYVVKNTAKQASKTATFMPKPIFVDNGSGMHVHQSLWKDGETLMHAGARLRAALAAGAGTRPGLLAHAPALWPSARPPTNSYRRLVPGYEAPVLLQHSPAQPLGRRPHPRVLARRRRPSGWNSAPPTRSPTPTSPSPRC